MQSTVSDCLVHQAVTSVWCAAMKKLFVAAVSGLLMCLVSGCIAGLIGNALPPPTIEAAYKGLAGHSVGVMVLADRAIKIDFPSIQLDLATSVQNKLKIAQTSDKKMKELKGTTFPVEPRSVMKYQLDHPEMEAEPITNVAPVLGTSRVIFIEVEDFQTRSDASLDLFRGSCAVTLKVLEVNGSQARVVYEENTIRSTVPKKPVEGVPDSSDYKTYRATIDDMSTQIVERFIPHPEEQE
jgi:hypothetical protein